MNSLLGIDLPQHKRAVLEGRLKGSALRDIIRTTVAHPDATTTPDNLIFVHRFLLWHLVFSPEKDERQALETEGLTSAFEETIGANHSLLTSNLAAFASEAIPRSKNLFKFFGTPDRWFPRLFPHTAVNWEETWCHLGPQGLETTLLYFTLLGFTEAARVTDLASFIKFGRLIGSQKRPEETDFDFLVRQCSEQGHSTEGLHLLLEGETPSYPCFRIGSEAYDESLLLWDHLRLAMAARGRSLTENFLGEKRNVLDHVPKGDSYLYALSPDKNEQVITFPDSWSPLKQMRAILVKNQWAIGYASASQPFEDRPDMMLGNIHIFKEFRGTSSSSNFFRLFLTSLSQKMGTRCFLIDRKRSTTLETEDEAHLTSFYLHHGFVWISDTVMAREIS
ncbi:MAG: hypothetical protein NT099_10075 [Candidatus Saganbacteria bacterium]|nr:hypothetical protein [Candidatus Saganbacteria bacterium]